MHKPEKIGKLPYFATGILAVYCSLVLVILAILGPLGLNTIPYRTSPGMLIHVKAQDLVNSVLAAPLCLISGILLFIRQSAARQWLILPGLYLFYTGFAYGTGNEWSSQLYNITGNTGKYCWFFLSLVIGGLYLAIAGLNLFQKYAIPVFPQKQKSVFICITAVCLSLFTVLWLVDTGWVIYRGTALSDTAYRENPAAFWVIKYLDLGIVLPLSFWALHRFTVNPGQAYPVLLLLFGFFMLTLTATVLMNIFKGSFLDFFTLVLVLLALLSCAGYTFLVLPRQALSNGGHKGGQ